VTAVTSEIHLDGVEDALAALRAGRPVIVVDDADRENEGDVVLAAAHADERWVAWAVRHGSGLLCAPMPAAWADRLRLPVMVEDNQDARKTAYTVTVDAAAGITTGISAADRALTLRLLAGERTTPSDLIRPGHVLPLRAVPGGVRERPGHTEAAVELCTLAGLPPVGMICELVADDGSMLRLPGLRRLCDATGLPLVSIADLADHLAERDRRERVERVAVTRLPTRHATFEAFGYRDRRTGAEHLALVAAPAARAAAPDGGSREAPLVRVHSECLTGDALGSLRCDCGPQLEASLENVAREGGAVVYLGGHEGRGIGLLAKLSAYQLQDGGLDTVAANVRQGLPADAREYGAAAAVLADLGMPRVRLLTNNPAKVNGLAAAGIEVAERVPLIVGRGALNGAYLEAKRDLMGHQL
jgi:3,4-dihydroxy 2-butanone 4-phosphate synthase/GTP cyclohydrolase II